MQTNRNAGCLSLKRYGQRQPVHNPLSGYFERRWVQEYRGRREKGGGSYPHPPDSGGVSTAVQPPYPLTQGVRVRGFSLISSWLRRLLYTGKALHGESFRQQTSWCGGRQPRCRQPSHDAYGGRQQHAPRPPHNRLYTTTAMPSGA